MLFLCKVRDECESGLGELTRNITSLHCTDEKPQREQATGVLHEDLGPRADAPEEHGDGQPRLGANLLGDYIEWDFSENEAQDEERLGSVDLGRIDVDVGAKGICEGGGDVGSIELHECEEQDDEGEDAEIDLANCNALLVDGPA